jgi:hypothetical protein
VISTSEEYHLMSTILGPDSPQSPILCKNIKNRSSYYMSLFEYQILPQSPILCNPRDTNKEPESTNILVQILLKVLYSLYNSVYNHCTASLTIDTRFSIKVLYLFISNPIVTRLISLTKIRFSSKSYTL